MNIWQTLVLSLASNLSLQEGRLSCRSESPDKLAFEAKDEVDPEVTAAAAAAIEAEVDTAVTEDDVDDDTGPGIYQKKNNDFIFYK